MELLGGAVRDVQRRGDAGSSATYVTFWKGTKLGVKRRGRAI